MVVASPASRSTRSRAYLVGLIGAGIGTSLTPPLHEQEAARLGMDYTYRVLDISELGVAPDAVGRLLEGAREAGFDGVNVTHPCKQLVLAHLDALSGEAAALGAANTVVLRDGQAVGHNTDGSGFAESFRRNLPDAALDRVLLIGAGGAGAAVAHALLGLACGRLEVLDTDGGRAEQLVHSLRERFGVEQAAVAGGVEEALAGVDGVVNATPTGMVGHGGTPVPAALLRPELWVADVVYRPLETELLRAARAAGCRILDGGGMVVMQAAGSFELFTGRRPDRERMLRHFAALAGR
jgi:shikimate dehydrogenase